MRTAVGVLILEAQYQLRLCFHQLCVLPGTNWQGKGRVIHDS